MQITLTPEQQAALCRGESITIDPPKPTWPFIAPTDNEYFLLKTGYDTARNEDHKQNNVFKHLKTVHEVARKLRFIMMCARFREHFEPEFSEVEDTFTDEKPAYYVYFSYTYNLFKVGSTISADCRSVVYMSENCAEALVTLLNTNQVPGFEFLGNCYANH